MRLTKAQKELYEVTFPAMTNDPIVNFYADKALNFGFHTVITNDTEWEDLTQKAKVHYVNEAKLYDI